MLWFLLGILTAFFFALTHILSKYISEKADPYYLGNTIWIIYSLLIFPFVILFRHQLTLNRDVLTGLILIGFLICSSKIIYLKSLKIGTVSRTIPLLSITPVFTFLIAMVWLKESPGFFGIIGIIIVVFGAYLLNINRFKSNRILAPLSSLFSDKASRLMLAVAFIYGFGSVVDKFVINHSNVITRVALFSYFTVFFNTAFLVLKDKQLFFEKTKKVFKFWKIILLINVFYASMLFCQMYGLTLTYTAYIITMKRMSAVFSIILAYFILKEKKDFSFILSGTILMAAGVFLLLLD